MALKKLKPAQKTKSVPSFLKSLVKKYKTPKDVQQWVHTLTYHKDDTVCSAKNAIKKKIPRMIHATSCIY